MKVPPFEMPLEEIRASLETLRRPMSVAIMRSKNAFNVGAIIRVAHSFLVGHILLVGDEPFYRRASMGMHRYENLVYLPNETALIEWSRAHNKPLVSWEREAAQGDMWKVELPESCVMVFGSESDGIAEEVLEASEQVVGIPMYGINNSFPITVAAGIAMAEWTRQYYGPQS